MAESIKFHASFPEPESYGLLKVKRVEFKLGLGPCGRHVTELWHQIDGDLGLLTITQLSRDPEDLKPPSNAEYLLAKGKIAAHDEILRGCKWHLVEPPKTTHQRVIKEYRWGFWPIYEYIETIPPKVVVVGALTTEELVRLQLQISAYKEVERAWRHRLESKTFIYKISDIHGRIEVVSS